MKTVIIHARYTDQYPLENYLIRKFGNKISVQWTRGKYQCELPRLLTSQELDEMKQSVTVEHYKVLE